MLNIEMFSKMHNYSLTYFRKLVNAGHCDPGWIQNVNGEELTI